MKINRGNISKIAIFTLLALVSFTLTQCRKKKDPSGVVTVVNASGTPVGGVTVIFSTVGTGANKGKIGDIKQTSTSGADGKVQIEEKLEMVLNVFAWKLIAGTSDSLKGTTYLKLEKNKNVTQTCTIN